MHLVSPFPDNLAYWAVIFGYLLTDSRYIGSGDHDYLIQRKV